MFQVMTLSMYNASCMNKMWVLYFSVIAGIVLVFLKADDCIDLNRVCFPSLHLCS